MTARSFCPPAQPPVRPLASGRWRATPGATVTASATVSIERAQLLWLPPGIGLQAMGCNVGAIAASTDLRFGIRADNNGLPGTLLLDAGTIAADTAGTRSLPITFTVPAGPVTGVPVWLTVTAQGSNTVSMVGVYPVSEYRDFGTAGAAIFGHSVSSQSGVTGALPTPFTLSSVSGPVPLLAVQAA
ncbi:hypothetical protein [Micromonospora profundi]|uniref:hypothetical protein n=1 Tax=Micromonospora profundi TaxID=1420889 RepID=UPI00364B4A35